MKTPFEQWSDAAWDGMDGLDEIDKMERAWKAAIAAHEAAKWRAPDELPDDCRDMLIVGSLSGLPSKTHTGYFDDGRWKSIIDDQQTGDALPISNVTAWQELPKTPTI